MNHNKNIIHEKSIPIPIQQKISTENNSPKIEYSLKKNFFDPTHSSPPNEFMFKLYMRNKIYNTSYKKDDNREIE
jgi:hypothetical protein